MVATGARLKATDCEVDLRRHRTLCVRMRDCRKGDVGAESN